MVKKVIKNIAWLLLERGGQIVAAIFIGALLARQLGVEGYGQFQYALAVVLIFSSLGLVCGAEVIVPRLVNTSSRAAHELLGNGFALRFGGALLAYLAMIGYALLTQGYSQTSLLITLLGLTVFFREPFGVVIAWLQSKTHNKPAALIGFIVVMIKLFLVFSLYHYRLGNVLSFASLWLLEAMLIAIGLVVIYRRQCNRFFFHWDFGGILSLFKAGLPFWAALISMYIFIRMDRILLKEFRNLSELGLYSAVMQISENMTMVAPIIAASAAPILVYRESNVDHVRKNIFKLAIAMFGIGICGAVLGTALAPWIVRILFGYAFSTAAPMLGYALFASTLVFIDAALNTSLIKQYSGRRILFKWLFATSIGLLIDCWAIPRWGGYGALMGFAVGYLVAIMLGSYWVITMKQRHLV